MTVWSLCITAGVTLHCAKAAETVVEAKVGNIFLRTGKNEAKQLTSSGRDSAPVLSPDGKRVVFVRALPGKVISTGSEDVEAQELWQVKSDGEGAALLVAPHENNDMQKVIASFDDVQFSPDGRLVYFLTPAWTTSGAVHAVDIEKPKARFLMDGNSLEVIHTGEYRGCLLVRQHRYFLGGGSYDWIWLFGQDGKEIGPVGEDAADFKDLYCPEK